MLRMGDNAQLVIGVAGRSGSGKSEVAQCLRDRFGFQYLRYSLVLAEWYHADPAAKPQLQDLGWNVMSGDGQRELNRRLIAQIDPKRDCAVDGLRHPIDFESLQNAFSSRFSLVYVDTPSEVRFERGSEVVMPHIRTSWPLIPTPWSPKSICSSRSLRRCSQGNSQLSNSRP